MSQQLYTKFLFLNCPFLHHNKGAWNLGTGITELPSLRWVIYDDCQQWIVSSRGTKITGSFCPLAIVEGGLVSPLSVTDVSILGLVHADGHAVQRAIFPLDMSKLRFLWGWRLVTCIEISPVAHGNCDWDMRTVDYSSSNRACCNQNPNGFPHSVSPL